MPCVRVNACVCLSVGCLQGPEIDGGGHKPLRANSSSELNDTNGAESTEHFEIDMCAVCVVIKLQTHRFGAGANTTRSTGP